MPVEDSTQREQGRARQGPGFDKSPCGLDRELHGRQFDRSRRQASPRFIVALPVERSLKVKGCREASCAEPAGETRCASEESGNEQQETHPPEPPANPMQQVVPDQSCGSVLVPGDVRGQSRDEERVAPDQTPGISDSQPVAQPGQRHQAVAYSGACGSVAFDRLRKNRIRHDVHRQRIFPFGGTAPFEIPAQLLDLAQHIQRLLVILQRRRHCEPRELNLAVDDQRLTKSPRALPGHNERRRSIDRNPAQQALRQ